MLAAIAHNPALGLALLFGWWQLRSVARDARETKRRREAEAREESDGPAA